MRYFTYVEPFCFDEADQVVGQSLHTIPESHIIKVERRRYNVMRPELQVTDEQLLDGFVAVHWAWETNEHGKALPRRSEQNPYVYQIHTDQVL